MRLVRSRSLFVSTRSDFSTSLRPCSSFHIVVVFLLLRPLVSLHPAAPHFFICLLPARTSSQEVTSNSECEHSEEVHSPCAHMPCARSRASWDPRSTGDHWRALWRVCCRLCTTMFMLCKSVEPCSSACLTEHARQRAFDRGAFADSCMQLSSRIQRRWHTVLVAFVIRRRKRICSSSKTRNRCGRTCSQE